MHLFQSMYVGGDYTQIGLLEIKCPETRKRVCYFLLSHFICYSVRGLEHTCGNKNKPCDPSRVNLMSFQVLGLGQT